MYRELDPSAFHGARAQSSWINLGLWRSGDAYAEACERMARAVGDAAALGPSDSVVDVGCGRGDSLLLWAEQYGCREVVGVNVTSSECRAAERLVRGRGEVHVVEADAIVALESRRQQQGDEPVDKIVSVDALYHVNTRAAFLRALPHALRAGGRFASIDAYGALDMAESAALRGGRWPGAAALWARPLRSLALLFLARAAGVPAHNLLYRAESALAVAGVEAQPVLLEDVTDRVYRPFSQFALAQVLPALREGRVGAALNLLGAGLFMRAMAASGLVRVVLLAADFP